MKLMGHREHFLYGKDTGDSVRAASLQILP
jgi:hypothetical protein